MHKFLVKMGDFISKYKYIFLCVFSVLFIICLININNVKVNENLADYLPDSTETKKGIQLMNEEFGNLTTLQVLVEDVSLNEVSGLTDNLKNISGVDAVIFDKDNNYKDSKALFMLELIDSSKEEAKEVNSNVLRVLSDYKVRTYCDLFEDATEGVGLVLLFIIIIITIVLIVSSKTYFEPVLAFLVFGFSVILNMGSNFIFGEISYITKAIAIILQLALSIDYIIIFMNQYMNEIKDQNIDVAIAKSITKTIPEIFASSLTTISGLLALIFMQLKIGQDIGIVLSKGIICSFLSVIFILPSFLYIFDKPIRRLVKKEKKNRSLLSKLSMFIVKSRKIVSIVFILFIAVGGILVTKYNYVYNQNSVYSVSASENIKNYNYINSIFDENNTIVVLFKNKEKDYDKEISLSNTLSNLDFVKNVTSAGNYQLVDNVYLSTKISYLDLSNIIGINKDLSLNLYKFYVSGNKIKESAETYKVGIIDLITYVYQNQYKFDFDTSMRLKLSIYHDVLTNSLSLLESENYSRIIVNIDRDIESKDIKNVINIIRLNVDKYYKNALLVGNSINAYDLKASFTSDNIIITIVTVVFIAIILFATFKNIITTILLIFTIEGSILITFGFFTLIGKSIFFMSYVVVCAIQMGATIDYAIVVASRYFILRSKMDKLEALVGTLNDTLPAVITSGLILTCSGFLIGSISTSSVVSSIGIFLGFGTLISLLSTILFLPSLLYIFDKFIHKKRCR